jgi:hypothetical protein
VPQLLGSVCVSPQLQQPDAHVMYPWSHVYEHDVPSHDATLFDGVEHGVHDVPHASGDVSSRQMPAQSWVPAGQTTPVSEPPASCVPPDELPLDPPDEPPLELPDEPPLEPPDEPPLEPPDEPPLEPPDELPLEPPDELPLEPPDELPLFPSCAASTDASGPLLPPSGVLVPSILPAPSDTDPPSGTSPSGASPSGAKSSWARPPHAATASEAQSEKGTA